jgi:hypothetical protein
MVMPMVQHLDGCAGLSMLANRSSGRAIVTTSWRDREAMRASQDDVRASQERTAEVFGGPAQAEEWEIAAMHRERTPGAEACARVTWIEGDPGDAEHNIDVFRGTTLPAVGEFAGFCSGSMLVDRGSGRAVATFVYADADALADTRTMADELRARTMSQMHAVVQDVHEFDLVVAHLHVPELV